MGEWGPVWMRLTSVCQGDTLELLVPTNLHEWLFHQEKEVIFSCTHPILHDFLCTVVLRDYCKKRLNIPCDDRNLNLFDINWTTDIFGCWTTVRKAKHKRVGWFSGHIRSGCLPLLLLTNGGKVNRFIWNKERKLRRYCQYYQRRLYTINGWNHFDLARLDCIVLSLYISRWRFCLQFENHPQDSRISVKGSEASLYGSFRLYGQLWKQEWVYA